jgi:hypothetical protein
MFHHVRVSLHVRSCVLACQVVFLDEVYSLSIHSFEDIEFVFSQFPLPGMEGASFWWSPSNRYVACAYEQSAKPRYALRHSFLTKVAPFLCSRACA